NVASTTETPLYDDVTYTCDSGWKQDASSTKSYSCDSSGDVRECSWINDSANNCLAQDVQVATSTSVSYEDAWVPLDMASSTDGDKSVQRDLPRGYRTAGVTENGIQVLPGQTVYFRVKMQTPDTQAMRFVLSAKGQKRSGSIDSMNLSDESTLQAKQK